MKQPLLGIVSLIGVVIIALGIISLFEEATFSTWVAWLFMALVPMQLVMAMVWQTNYPSLLARMSQPLKGLVMTLITMVVGLSLAVLSYHLVGKGHGITPMLMMYSILVVVVTFWYAALWHCWPVTLLSSNPLIIGLSVLVVAYLGGYIIFQLLFDFSFLKGAPVYFADADPGGLFMAWSPLVMGISTVAAIMLFPLFEGWPVRAIRNPSLGVLASTVIAVALGGLLYTACTMVLGMDQIRYMILIPISFIFGTFVPLTFFQGGLLKNMEQPLKGILLVLLCTVAAFILQRIYLFMGPIVSGPLAAGPAGHYQEELWLANALLGLTFPLLVILLDYFQFWPLASNEHAADKNSG